MAIRRGEYDYLLPTALHEELMLATWLTASDGKLTMQRRFQLIRQCDQATVLRARWDLVCIEVSSGRARRMPPEFCQAYQDAMVAAA
jgi:acyl-CoA thioester hydrolase